MPAIVDILLATYNGEQYLNIQLQSIFEQDFQDFRILIRDDGSADSTRDIIAQWVNLHPDKVIEIRDEQKNVGATANFSILMEHASAEYICFSDQDDKWLPNKISTQLAAIQQLEGNNRNIPAFVFSDLTLCDEQLNITHPSLNDRDHLDPDCIQAHRLLMQNVPYGCATMINKALLQQSTPIPREALLHDHWLAVSAALLGKIAFIDESLLLHRIHQRNASRAESQHKKEAKEGIENKLSNANFHNYLFKQVAQAEALLNRHQPLLKTEQIKMLQNFILLKSTRGMQRKMLIIRNRFFKNNLLPTLKLLLRA